MVRFDGSLARALDFGGMPSSSRPNRRRLSLLRGPDKYKVLEHRRRTAQIKARHALDLIEMMEQATKGK
jgi:hypothetical protein